MRKSGYEGIEENKAVIPTYPTSIGIINAPNGIPSLGISIEPNTNTRNLTVEELIDRVKARYASVGLKNEFPADKITIMVNGVSYNLSNKAHQIYDNGTIPTVRVMFPKIIEPQYLLTKNTATESTSLTGRENKSLFQRIFG